jgi:hypothetical protein
MRKLVSKKEKTWKIKEKSIRGGDAGVVAAAWGGLSSFGWHAPEAGKDAGAAAPELRLWARPGRAFAAA